MKSIKLPVAVAFALVMAFAVTGCSKVTGGMEVFMQGDPTVVVAAAESALNELQMSDVKANSTKVDGKLTAVTARDKKVSIDVKSAGENVSKFTVQVGKMGDKSISQRIIDKTKAKLPG